MKKLKYLFYLVLFIPTLVFASDGDRINRIDVNIALDASGNAHIKEVWDVYAGSGTEFYKAEYNLRNMEITNFQVIDENNKLFTFIDEWDIDGSLSEKAYKNGFYYNPGYGLELCWGKSTYGSHKYTISYDVSNFIFNTNDAQVMYWSILNEMEDMPETFTATITGPTYFEDTLDVWGYGYKGYAYVSDGTISMSNEENTDLSTGDYAVLLVKFPLNTFANNPDNRYEEYITFDDVLGKAEAGTFDYDYGEEKSIWQTILGILATLFWPICIILVGILATKGLTKYKFGPAGSHIDMKTINNFREIPCKKDIFRAYFLAQAYKLNSKNTDFLGSVFLKWLFEDKIQIKDMEKSNLFGKKSTETSIILNDKATFNNDVEKDLYEILIKASKDNILEQNELVKWSKNNYNSLFNWFEKAEKLGRDYFISENTVIKEQKGFSPKYMISDEVKVEAIELAGLKKFLLEFSRIQEKTAIEVKLWKEYLMFAQIFGIADKIAEQFKKLYPDVLTEMNDTVNMNNIILINNLSRTTVASASSARSAAQSYSGGGGGFSSGGGGGGSFGGGGGGGR